MTKMKYFRARTMSGRLKYSQTTINMTSLRNSLQSLCGLMDAIYQQQRTGFFSDGPPGSRLCVLGAVELLKLTASILWSSREDFWF